VIPEQEHNQTNKLVRKTFLVREEHSYRMFSRQVSACRLRQKNHGLIHYGWFLLAAEHT